MEFKPGLNILVRPNGSGKSTVLRMLAESMCAFRGGVSAVGESTIHDCIDVDPLFRLEIEAVLRARYTRPS